MRSILRALAFSAVLLAVAGTVSAARAQTIPSSYEYIEKGQGLELFAGYLNTNEGQFGFGPSSGVTLGGRWGVEISGPLGLDLVATLLPSDRDVVNPARDEGDRVVGVAESALIFIEGRLRFAITGRRTWRSIQPYVYLGAGVGFDVMGDQQEDQLLVENDRFEFGTKFTGNGGLGARIFLADRWVLRTEAGFLIYQLSTPSGFADPARDLGVVPESEWVNGVGLSIGLAWLR